MHAHQILNLTLLSAADEGGLPGIPGGGPSGIPGSAGGDVQAAFAQPSAPTGGGLGQVFELAGWWTRFAAWLVDVVFLCLLLIPLVLIAGVIGIDTGTSASSGSSASFSAEDGQFLAIMFLWWIGVILYAPTTMSRMQGSTPGKRIMGIRVVRADGSPLTFGFAFFREVLIKGVVVQAVGVVTFGLGWFINYVWPLWDSENRALHDFAVRSRVVRR